MTDTIFSNGLFYTQGPACPTAAAIAVQNGRITAVGTDDQILELARSDTQIIDLQKRRVLPGLTDSHFHFYEWSLFQSGIDLDKTTSKDSVLELVRTAATSTPPGEWIRGQGWNQNPWPDPALPNRYDLDQVSPDHPVILWRTDLHLAWVNSKALAAAGINAQMPDPPMGIIDRDQDGQPTGILRELAINLIRNVLPEPPDSETDSAMRQAMKMAHRLGLTGVHDYRIMGGGDGPPALRAWQRLRDNDQLALRAWVMLPGELLEEAIALGLRTGFGDDFLRIGGIKLFSDGSMGARTAWMLEPFADGKNGIPLTPMDEIAQKIALAQEAGISTATHAIGDRAIHELLNTFSLLRTNLDNIKPYAPHRIEHVQHSRPEDLARLASLGLVASVQPIHAASDMNMIDQAIGDRGRWTYAFRTLLDAGTVLAFGSDCPVASPNPFLGIHAAVTRQNSDGVPPGGWYPQERLTIQEAIWGYTMGPAIASGQEYHLGSLSPGKLADLVVLDRDIFAISPQEIPEINVVMTIINGKVAFKAR